mgnify:CR=1 FL=1
MENRYAYDAFGNLLGQEEAFPNRILYAGQLYDQKTDQYYLRARYYNPTIGRFSQEDTYWGDGLNLYAYCANNPVRYFDPSGHQKKPNCPGTEGEAATDKQPGVEIESGRKSKNPMTGGDWHNYFNENYGADNVTWESASIQDIIDMPSKITDFSPKQISNLASRNGWTVEPLGKGRLAGIPYEQGGGISMHAPNGSSIYIQYHPGSGHHGVMPYYKISSGKNGIVRYYINGERVQ